MSWQRSVLAECSFVSIKIFASNRVLTILNVSQVPAQYCQLLICPVFVFSSQPVQKLTASGQELDPNGNACSHWSDEDESNGRPNKRIKVLEKMANSTIQCECCHEFYIPFPTKLIEESS